MFAHGIQFSIDLDHSHSPHPSSCRGHRRLREVTYVDPDLDPHPLSRFSPHRRGHTHTLTWSMGVGGCKKRREATLNRTSSPDKGEGGGTGQMECGWSLLHWAMEKSIHQGGGRVEQANTVRKKWHQCALCATLRQSSAALCPQAHFAAAVRYTSTHTSPPFSPHPHFFTHTSLPPPLTYVHEHVVALKLPHP